MIRLVVLALALVLGACASEGIAPVRSISKIESRTLPQGIVMDRVMRQLGDILVGTPAGRPGVKPVRPLDSLWFWTRPRATEQPDTCQSDLVIIGLTPTLSGSGNADSPTRASTISASPYFYLLQQPSPGPEEYLTEAGQRQLQGECVDLDPNGLQMVAAPDAYFAREGAKLFDRTKQLYVSAPEKFVFNCGKDDACGGVFSTIDFASVNGVDRCDPLENGQFSTCWRFNTGEFAIRVFVNWKTSPDSIERVAVEQLVFLADSRLD